MVFTKHKIYNGTKKKSILRKKMEVVKKVGGREEREGGRKAEREREK